MEETQYGIFQFCSRGTANPGNCPRRWSGNLGCDQSSGRLRPGQPCLQKPMHETAYFTACGQTAILENGDLAAALSRLSEQEPEELIALRKLQEEIEKCRHE